MPDRMERCGMRWTIKNALAMLDGWRPDLNGEWNTVMRNHIDQETHRVSPHRARVASRAMLEGMEKPMAA
jgi:hypothetical protein